MQKDYTKIGGWLLFFVIIGCLVALVNLGTGVQMLSYGYILLGILILAGVALRVTVVVQIFRRDETARYWLIAEGAVLTIANLYTCYLTQWDAGTLGTTVGGIGGYVLWYFYLAKSQRVAVYMHPDQYARMMPPVMPYGQYPQQPGQPQYPTQPMYSNQPQPTQPAQPQPTQAAQQANQPQPTQPAPAQPTAVCPVCGRPTVSGAKFCGGCGSRL